MDLTMAFDEVKRIKSYLDAITVSEETMKRFVELEVEVPALEKKKSSLEKEIASLGPAYESAKVNHKEALRGLASEVSSARAELESVKSEIKDAIAKGAEAASAAKALLEDEKKKSKEFLAGVEKEVSAAGSKLEELQAAIKKITG